MSSQGMDPRGPEPEPGTPSTEGQSTEVQRLPLASLVVDDGGLRTGPFGHELSSEDYRPQGVPVILPQDLAGGELSDAGAARVAPETARGLEQYRLRAGDVLLARRGELGRCAVVEPEAEGWLCGTGCLRIRLDGRLRPEVLVQYLRWGGMVRWLEGRAVGQTMANLSIAIVAELPVAVPSPWAQEKIIALTKALEEGIQLAVKIREERRRLHDIVLREALGGRALGRRELPEGWRLRPLAEVCKLVNGHRFRREDWSDRGWPILRISNLNGSRNFKYFSGYPKEPWRVRPGDLLLPWSGSGRSLVPVLWQGPEGVLNQHIFRIEPKPGVERRWLYEALRVARRRIRALSVGFKDNFVHLRKGDLERLPLPVPPPREQQRIAVLSDGLADLRHLDHKREELLKRRLSLVRRDLFTGRWIEPTVELAKLAAENLVVPDHLGGIVPR